MVIQQIKRIDVYKRQTEDNGEQFDEQESVTSFSFNAISSVSRKYKSLYCQGADQREHTEKTSKKHATPRAAEVLQSYLEKLFRQPEDQLTVRCFPYPIQVDTKRKFSGCH